MADNTEEQTAAEASATGDAQSEAHTELLTGDAGFTYWLVMLPFLAIAGVFIFEFSKHSDLNKLINAAGAVVVGIFVASFVNILSEGSKHNEEHPVEDTAKPEGSA